MFPARTDSAEAHSYTEVDRWIRTTDPGNPLEPKHGQFSPNGEFHAGNVTYQNYESFSNPGFLVVLIKNKRRDFIQTKATFHAVSGSLMAGFDYCGVNVPTVPVQVSSKDELEYELKRRGKRCSHIILVGDCSDQGLDIFGNYCSATELKATLDYFKDDPKQLITLCGKGEDETFAETLSNSDGVSSVLTPKVNIPKYYAAHFILGYFIDYFFEATSVSDAVLRATMRSESQDISIWQKGLKIASEINAPN